MIKKSKDPGKYYWNHLNAEGHTYNRRNPIWSGSQISFDIMVPPTIIKSYEPGGEIEIEKIPTRAQREGHIPKLRSNLGKRIHGSRDIS